MTQSENIESRLEQELRTALHRRPAPERFADRVLARARQEETRRRSAWFGMFTFKSGPAFRIAVTAAVLVAIIGGFAEYRSYEERRAGEHAKEELMLALRVTRAKLQYAQEKVNGVESQQLGIQGDGAERLQ